MSNVRKIAIVNRGEAASRCLRAIRELRSEEGSDLTGIALYTDPDRLAPFVREADESIALGAPFQTNRKGERSSVYLDYDRLLAALEGAHADTVWPGWGFVSEHPEFARRVTEAGLTFLGPSAETMQRLGDKIASKRIAEASGVPVAPWSGGPVSRETVERWAGEIGYPVVLKATAGGGGRGIRVVGRQAELLPAFESATSEAQAAFGDGTLFMEKRVERARHIEIQMAADQHGQVLAVGARDCSVQRKHQKVVEEGPPPGVTDALASIGQASIQMLKSVGYQGVATCEFLMAPNGDFCFLEVNPRLQVEHGVTELLTGMDLVKTQVRIARGEHLPRQAPSERGAAIEVRLCAEDPGQGFAPTPGHIALLGLPAGPGIRVDSGIAAGTSVPSEFDSMIAKIISYGATRAEARARLVRGLAETRVVLEGGMTNKGFLLDVLEHPDFVAGGVDTAWLDAANLARQTPPAADALLVAAIQAYQEDRATQRINFFAEASRGRPMHTPPSIGKEIDLVYNGTPYRLAVFALGGWTYRVYHGESLTQLTLLERGPYARLLVTRERRVQVLVSSSAVEIRVEVEGRQHRVERDVGGRVRAPSPSLLIELSVKAGNEVATGDRLGLFEAMKCETAFHAPLAGVVREVLARPGERLNAGDVILVIEPSSEGPSSRAVDNVVEFSNEADPLGRLVLGDGQRVELTRANDMTAAERREMVEALKWEVRRILLGYDVNPSRGTLLMNILSSSLDGLSENLCRELDELVPSLSLFADLEVLFSKAPTQVASRELGPSNDARMAMYLRRIAVRGAGIDEAFLSLLRAALAHYGRKTLEPSSNLERNLLRLYSTRTTRDLRNQLVTALLGLAIKLGEAGYLTQPQGELRETLERLWQLRGTVTPTVSDLAAQARFMLFDRPAPTSEQAARMLDRTLTIVPPPEGVELEPYARELGITVEEVRRFELWRLANFNLERIDLPGFDDTFAVFGRAKSGNGDDRLFVFSEIADLGPDVPHAPDLSLFEHRFHAAIEALRSVQRHRFGAHRLHWNRLYLLIRPPVVLTKRLISSTALRLAPETGHVGLERVIVRTATLASAESATPPKVIELLLWNPSGNRVEWNMRVPHDRPLEPATPYERRVALARARGLTYPYEIVRLFTAPPEGRERLGQPTGSGKFVEYDLSQGKAVPVNREPGQNETGIVFGIISTPTRKHREGVRRVLILSDPTHDMGALSLGECSRIVAAIDLAEAERLPVEWVAVSAGARIAMDTGTENLDATALVVRRLVTFTDGGGEVNLILPGVNVGAQSYFDALSAMELRSRGVLIMIPNASMILTGRAALEFAGGVSAEDEVGIGGYERIMGPNGEAHFRGRDLADAYSILLDHYAVSYVAPGEAEPRRFDTTDDPARDITLSKYDGDEGYSTIGDLFSSETNPGRKRPFAMRPLLAAVADADGGALERWRDWSDAQSAIVWDSHIGGHPATLIGIESRQVARIGYTPNDGPTAWTAATLFPHSSKKVARALNAASGNRPVVILANLSGFDGSPESMRRGILEMGAEIARAVVRFQGRIAFVVVTRYHGGAYVVFSRKLNDNMRVAALSGSYASVIGGAAAAAVVFTRDVRKRAQTDPRVIAARENLERATNPAQRAEARAEYDRTYNEVLLDKQAEVALEFDEVHTVERAREVGSIERILDPTHLRPTLIEWLGG